VKQSGKYVVLILSLLLAVTCTWLWRGYQDAARQKIQAAAAAEQARRAEELRAAAPAAKRPPAKESLVRAALEADPAKRAKNIGGGKPVTADMVKSWYEAVNNPMVLRHLAAEARALTVERYASFFAQLHLTPEQAEALSKLLDDKRQAALDLAVASFQNGVDPRDDLDAFQARVFALRETIEPEIRSFLGDEGYAEYLAYNQMMGQATAFIRMEREIGGTENALHPEQADQLRQMLLKSPNGLVTPEIISSAQSFLSPSQLKALQDAYAAQGEIARARILQTLPTESVKK
jgi:hypothetical protein